MEYLHNSNFDELDNLILKPYNQLNDFKLNYINDYKNFPDYSFIEYLELLVQVYEFNIKVCTETDEDIYSDTDKQSLIETIDININLLNVYCKEMNIDSNLPQRNKFVTVCKNNRFAIYMFLVMNYEDIVLYIKGEIFRQEIYNQIPKNNFKEIDVKKRFTTPINIAILKELGVFGALAKKGFNRKSIIDTLYQITGANSKNLEKYYDSMVKNDNIEFNNIHTEKAKEFLNSKGY